MSSRTRVAKRGRKRRGLLAPGVQFEFPRRPLALLTEVRILWEEATPALPPLAARTAWSLAVLFLATYAAALIWLSPLPLQDLPNHLARAQVMSDLIFQHGARFGQQFEFHFLAIPYILGDFILAVATESVGTTGAAILWSTFVFLCLPCALLVYLRTSRLTSEARALLLILSVYLSTDWFFLMGFLEFRLGIAITLITLAVAERVRARHSGRLFALYAAVLVLGYLAHLSTLIFTTALLGTTALVRLWRRTTTVRTETWLLLPCAILLVWHFSAASAYRDPSDLVEVSYIWGTLQQKFTGLSSEFMRFTSRADALMMAALALCLALQAGRVRRSDFKDPVVLEMLGLAAAMFGLYFVLPMGYAEAYFVDVRALPLAFLFLILACLSLPARAPAERFVQPSWAVAVATLLVMCNLAYLVKHLGRHSQWQAQYRAVVTAVPRGARVFPIYTHGTDGKIAPLFHTFSFVAIDRDGVVPYLQTGDTGNPQKYVRYKHRPYAPEEKWYGYLPAMPVDWRAVACDYDYLLVTKPFEAARLAVATLPVLENEAAALLAVVPQPGCAAR